MSPFTLYDDLRCLLGLMASDEPVFYSTPYAIRFNIGEDNGFDPYLDHPDGGNRVDPRYVAECRKRIMRIYDSLPTKPDLLVIEGYVYDKPCGEYISKVMTACNLPYPEDIHTASVCRDGESCVQLHLCRSLETLDPEPIMNAVILADLGSGNTFLTSAVYVVCTADKVLFHVYDDRGADVAAYEKETIRCLYNGLNDLILDCDRESIDAVFRTV